MRSCGQASLRGLGVDLKTIFVANCLTAGFYPSSSTSLNHLEQSLPSEAFVRVHRSAIINLNHLDEIVR